MAPIKPVEPIATHKAHRIITPIERRSSPEFFVVRTYGFTGSLVTEAKRSARVRPIANAEFTKSYFVIIRITAIWRPIKTIE